VVVEVDSYSAEAAEVVEGAAGLELAEHQLEVGLKSKSTVSQRAIYTCDCVCIKSTTK
jgi:hypothetical protein